MICFAFVGIVRLADLQPSLQEAYGCLVADGALQEQNILARQRNVVRCGAAQFAGDSRRMRKTSLRRRFGPGRAFFGKCGFAVFLLWKVLALIAHGFINLPKIFVYRKLDSAFENQPRLFPR